MEGLPAVVVEYFQNTERFAVRFHAAVRERLGPPPAALPDQAAVLAMDASALDGLALRAGAAWHGRAMAQAVDGASVRALVGAIGPELHRVGLAHGARRPATGAALPAPDRIVTALEEDGYACLLSWCLAQPASVGQEVALRLPPHPAPGDEHRASGPGIVAALAVAGRG